MVLKFLHIQSHFIHLYFLTIFEVFFYIYYIMPYEKSIFNHLFDDDISMLHKLNTTNYISDSDCSKYQNKLMMVGLRFLNHRFHNMLNLYFLFLSSSNYKLRLSV